MVERELTKLALRASQGDTTEAARILGVPAAMLKADAAKAKARKAS